MKLKVTLEYEYVAIDSAEGEFDTEDLEAYVLEQTGNAIKVDEELIRNWIDNGYYRVDNYIHGLTDPTDGKKDIRIGEAIDCYFTERLEPKMERTYEDFQDKTYEVICHGLDKNE